jgi:virginiamycin A acetyltransferase
VSLGLRAAAKNVAFALATIAVVPWLASFMVRARVFGRDRALAGSSQSLALIPGITGQYFRRAFFARALTKCHRSATIEFGTVLSRAGAVIDERVYVGPRCHLGLVHLEADVLLAAGVHVTSGRRTHGTDDVAVPIRDQQGEISMVHIGQGSWVGSAAVVMADVGTHSVVGAGAVVTQALPPFVVAGGVPARVLRRRTAASTSVRTAEVG